MSSSNADHDTAEPTLDHDGDPSAETAAATSANVLTAAAATSTTVTLDGEDEEDAAALANACRNRLEEIWDTHLEEYRRIDELEKRIDEHAVRLRRRFTNLLETAPTHRLSHLRLFVSHHARSPASAALVAAHQRQEPEKQPPETQEKAPEQTPETAGEGAAGEDAATAPATETATTADESTPSDIPTPTNNNDTPKSTKWTLVVEGKLLIDHLDHASAKAFDERLKREFQKRHDVPADHSSMPLATSENTSATANPTEEEEPVQPIMFTHFFDKLVAQFQSVYQPITEDTTGTSATGELAAGGDASTPRASTPKNTSTKSSGKKKSRSAKRQKNAAAAAAEMDEGAEVDLKDLVYSDPEEYTWNKLIPISANAAAAAAAAGKPATVTTSTKDAAAFFVHYDSPPPPSSNMKLFGAIATVQLYPSRGPDHRYKPSKPFGKIFFPKHVDVVAPPVLPTRSIADAKKADEHPTEDDTTTTPAKSNKRKTPTVPAHQLGPMALENEIHVPTSLTMKEILMSLSLYVQHHKLISEEDPTMIQNDKTLEELFQCESMHFHDLETLLTQKKLVLLLPKPAPVVLKYVLKADNSNTNGEPLDEDEALAAPMTTDLHNDIYVPSMFPSRIRECLRRIKRRELEYTGSRTKARYLLMASRAKDESVVKTKIEEAICGTTLGEWPILTCLAKAAHPHSEARITAQLDAKIAYLLDQMEHHQLLAQQAYDLLDFIRSLGEEEEEEDDEVAEDENTKEDTKPPAREKSDPMQVDESVPTSSAGEEKETMI